MGVFGLGGTRKLRFFGTGKLMNPSPPGRLNRSAGMKAIRLSGGKSTREMKQKMQENNSIDPRQLGQAAVKITKSQGISVNITV